MTLQSVTLTDPHFVTIRGRAGDLDVAIADWQDDVEGGPQYQTRQFAGYSGNKGSIWHRGPTLVGLPAVVAWLREHGATGLMVSVVAGWDGETK